MVKICSHTIAKNSEDFIELVLRQILPYTARSIVSVDVDSPDRTKEILIKLREEYPHLEIWDYKVENPFTDLVKERNRQLKNTKEEIIWIVDDDEYYQDKEIKDILEKIDLTVDAYSVKFWFLTDLEHYNPARGKRTIRFYKNLSDREWQKEFGKEFIPVVDVQHLDNSYVHLSYLKKKSWRNDFGEQKYKYTIQTPNQKLPEEIIKELCKTLEHF